MLPTPVPRVGRDRPGLRYARRAMAELPALPAALAAELEVIRLLGRGAFATVHEVRARRDGARYALKVIDLGDQDQARAAREIQASLGMRHPRVIRCHSGRTFGSVALLLLELAQGSLEDSLRDPQRLPASWTALRQAAEGVAAIHAAGMIHRDLKPGNVLLTPEGAKVADLGMARGESLADLTRTGTILGTPGYMAPEQARGEPVTAAADVFALGVMFYEAIEGRLPYPEDSTAELLHRVATGRLDDLHKGRTLLAVRAQELLRQALAPAPGDRPRDLLAWLAELGEYDLAKAPAGPGEARTEILGGAPESRTVVASSHDLPIPQGATVPLAAAAPPPLPEAPAPGRGRGVGTGLAFLALMGVGFMGRGTPPAPSPAPTAPPPTSPAALGPDLAADVEVELGRLRPDLVDIDPNAWPEVLRRLPAVRRFHEWVAAGGAAEGLPPKVLASLRAADQRMATLGLPMAFHPYVYLTPAPSPVLPDARLLAAFSIASEAPPALPEAGVDGWLGTALVQLRAVQDAMDAQTAAMEDFIAKRGGGGLLRELADSGGLDVHLSLQKATTMKGLMKWIRRSTTEAASRRVLERWTRPLQRASHGLHYAVARSLHAQPELRDQAVALLWVMTHPIVGFGARGFLDIEVRLGGIPPSRWGSFAAGWVQEQILQSNELAPEVRATLEERVLDLQEAALEPPGGGLLTSFRSQVALRFLIIALQTPERAARQVELFRRYQDEIYRLPAPGDIPLLLFPMAVGMQETPEAYPLSTEEVTRLRDALAATDLENPRLSGKWRRARDELVAFLSAEATRRP